MTQSLPSSCPAAPPAAPGSKAHWLTSDQASRLSGHSPRHINRLAGSKWWGQGLAEMRPVPGQKDQWFIDPDADPAFTIISAPAVPVSAIDLRQVPLAAREKAQERARILAAWEKAVAAGIALNLDRDRATGMFLEALPARARISRGTLYNWSRAFKREGLLGLVDGRGKESLPPAAAGEDPFLAEVERFWLDQRRRKVALCYELALVTARDRGWKICAYRTARRHIQALQKEKPALVVQKREGQSAFTDKIERFINRDYSTLASNEFWNADHHVFDVIVKVGEKLDPNTGEKVPVHARPWLTAWQDVRSRKIVGWLIRAADPNTDAIIESLRRACATHHLPETVYTDNGKDFDCRHLTGQTKAMRWKNRKLHVAHDQQRLGGIYAAIGVAHIHCWPYHGQSKPIERFFNTLEDRFGRTFETYCGSTPQEKPEDLPEQLARGKAPDLERFIALFEEWLELGYHQKIHTGDAMDCRPAEAWEANLATIRTAPAELLEVALQRRIGPVKVGQNGVTYKHLWFGQYALAAYHGQEVYLTIADDLAQVGVWSSDGRFLCHAPSNRKLPFHADHQMLNAALAEKRSANKTLRAARSARMTLAQDIPDTMIRAAAHAAAQAGQRPELPPPSFTAVRTGLEDQLPALRMPMKKAVGDDTPSPAPFSYRSQETAPTDGNSGGFVYHRSPSEASDE